MATTKNTLIVIGDTTISTSIKPTLVDELRKTSKATGKSLSWIMNHALDAWLAIEAPVYLAHAKEAQGQRV